MVEKWKDSLTHEGLQRVIDVGCRHVGLESLKPEQLDAVCLLLEGKSVFVTLPTGYGKSQPFFTFCLFVQAVFSLCWMSRLDVQSSLFEVTLPIMISREWD